MTDISWWLAICAGFFFILWVREGFRCGDAEAGHEFEKRLNKVHLRERRHAEHQREAWKHRALEAEAKLDRIRGELAGEADA